MFSLIFCCNSSTFCEQQWCAQRIRQHASWQQDFLFCSRLFPTSGQRRDFPTTSWRATMASRCCQHRDTTGGNSQFQRCRGSCLNMVNWKEKISNKDLGYFYFLMTTEEFYNRGQNIMRMDGQQRMPMWTHVACLPLEQATHLHQQCQRLLCLGNPGQRNILKAVSEGRAHIFSRANMNLQLQIDGIYNLNKMQIDNMIVLKVIKDVYEPLRLFEWKQGFLWLYNLLINMTYAEDQQLAWFFKQSVEYGGTAMVQQMSTRSLNTLMQWCYINSLALNGPAKTIERLRASTLFIPWLTDSNQAWLTASATPMTEFTAETPSAVLALAMFGLEFQSPSLLRIIHQLNTTLAIDAMTEAVLLKLELFKTHVSTILRTNQRPRGGDQQNNKMKLINVKNIYVHRESMSEGFQKDWCRVR